MTASHILVVGAGSVGKRHLGNFASLGCRVSAMDPREDRVKEAAEVVSLVDGFQALDAALKAHPYSGVVICSPPAFHVEQSIAALAAGLPVLLEKPVSPDAQSTARLVVAQRESGVPLLLGYTYRWWEPLREVKRRIEAGSIGSVLHVRCVMSAHLADWHPWEDYRDFFMASRELGGGALLDESHFLDLMLWLFGVPSEVTARVEKLSDLEIETDDNVDALLRYPGKLRVSMHLDLFGRPHEKFITFTGELGTLHWSFEPNEIRYGAEAAQVWERTFFRCERNDMFLGVAREFLDIVRDRASPSCTIEDGYALMRVLEAMRQSSDTGQSVDVN